MVIELADYILRRPGPLRALNLGHPNYFCAPRNPPSIFFHGALILLGRGLGGALRAKALLPPVLVRENGSDSCDVFWGS